MVVWKAQWLNFSIILRPRQLQQLSMDLHTVYLAMAHRQLLELVFLSPNKVWQTLVEDQFLSWLWLPALVFYYDNILLPALVLLYWADMQLTRLYYSLLIKWMHIWFCCEQVVEDVASMKQMVARWLFYHNNNDEDEEPSDEEWFWD